MNLHKDKERLRHQRQVKLLEDAMKILPKPSNDSASKVRKLRHLVLHYHYMKKVHEQITMGHSSMINGYKTPTKKYPVKSPYKSLMMHCETKKKSSRANIVFLQIDRSKNEEENISGEPIVKDNGRETIYNSPKSPHMKNLEYKVPEIVVDNEVHDSNATFDDSPCLPIGNIMQSFSNNLSSSDNLSLQSDLASEDNYNAGKENCSPVKQEPNDQVREQSSMYYKKRVPENYIKEDNVIHIKRRKTDFQNILQDYSSNSTLRDVIVSDAINENFYVTNVNYPEYDSKYVLNENISGYPIKLSSGNVILTKDNINYRPLYSIDSTLVESQLQNVPSLTENLSDNCSSSTLTDNIHIDVENFSDSSNEVCKIKAVRSSNLNAKNNVYDSSKEHVYDSPKEHVYDSPKAHAYDSPKAHAYDSPKAHAYDSPKAHAYDSPKAHAYDSPKAHACDSRKAHAYDSPKTLVYDSPETLVYDSPKTLVYDSPETLVYDSPKTLVYDSPKTLVYDSPKTLVYDSPKAFVYDFPYSTLMNYDYALPYVSSSQNYLENYTEQNEILSRPVGYLPHFDTISPKNVTYNESPSVIQYFEPIHSFQDRLVEPRFANDNASIYMPSTFESYPSERLFLLNSKSEIIKSEPDSQDDSEESKPRIFEEEVSYPLSQYINNYYDSVF